MKRFITLPLILLLCCCGTEPAKQSVQPETPVKLPEWTSTKVFANNADEEPISYRYPQGRWLEKFWVVQKPEQAKVANMYPTPNGFVTEGIGLLDIRGKTVSSFDRLQTEAISDGDTIYTTNPQTSDYVLALRDDGTTAWQSRIGEKSRGEGSFFLEEGNLVFLLETPQGYRVTRFDRKSGSIVWQNDYQIDSGFSSTWAQGSGSIWILTTIQGENVERILCRMSARTGKVDTFSVNFRKPFAACKNFIWYLDRDRLFKFHPESGKTVSVAARDALSVQNVGQFLLVNSVKQPKLLDPADSNIHMLFPDQVQVFDGVVFQVLQKMIVAVDPETRDELWKIDFDEAVQSVAYSRSCVAVQTTEKIYFFKKR